MKLCCKNKGNKNKTHAHKINQELENRVKSTGSKESLVLQLGGNSGGQNACSPRIPKPWLASSLPTAAPKVYLLQFLPGPCCHPASALLIRGLFFLFPVTYYVGTLGTHTEIKRVAEEKVTLPCHHQLGLPEKDTLDIEWLLTDNEGNQKVVSTLLATVALPPALTSPSSAFTSCSRWGGGRLEEFVFSSNVIWDVWSVPS